MDEDRTINCVDCETLAAVGQRIDDNTIAGDHSSMPLKILINKQVGDELRSKVSPRYRSLMRMRFNELYYRTVPCEIVDAE